MWFTSSLRCRRTPRHPSHKRRSFLPRLEIIEDRTVPSTLTVTNNLDKGAGSLRDAITNAKSGDTIVFAPALNGQTITLTSGELAINKSLDIEGPDASLLAISGNDTNRVFDISEGNTVTIAGLTISQGRARDSDGGGVLNVGSTLTAVGDIFSDNEALVNSTSAIDGGGAICNRNGATLTVTQCSFLGNEALGRDRGSSAYGGAILNIGSVATVRLSTFMANRVVGGNGGEVAGNNNLLGLAVGGGIKNSGGGLLTVEHSTFLGNQAIAGNGGSGGKGAALYLVDNAAGGGIAGSDDTTSIVSDCTFAYNQAIGGSYATGGTSGQGRLGNANGGGLFNDHMTTVTGCTFDRNEAIAGNSKAAAMALSCSAAPLAAASAVLLRSAPLL